MSFPVKIEKIVFGGNGLGRLADGKIVLVPYVVPGEQVVVRQVRSKKSYIEASLIKILHSAQERTEPPCPYFMQCGGCNFQHIRSDKQTEIKNQILFEQLERSDLLQGNHPFLFPPLASPLSFHYRQRIRLHLGRNGNLGFHRNQSHEVQPIKKCLLAREQINEVLAYLRGTPGFDKLAGIIDSVELLLSPVEGSVTVILHLSRKPRPAERKCIVEIAKDGAGIKGIVVLVKGVGFIDLVYGTHVREKNFLLHFSHALPEGSNLHMTIEPGGFCQVNAEQNEQLIAHVVKWAETDAKSKVLDLFCGMGNFSLPLARRVESVVGMDLQRSAIRSAIRNAELNGLENCSFVQKSAIDGAKILVAGKKRFDIVLLDPPREGCAAVLPSLVKLGVSKVIYISCDPATLCRDLQIFIKEGYMIEKMKMVDMFPQTHHIETIVSLCR